MGPKWKYSGAIQIEVESALDTGVPMIPLLVNGAQIAEVVATLEGRATIIGDLNAASLDHSSWNRDLIPVIEAVRKHLGEQAKPAGPSIDKTSSTPAGDWRAGIVNGRNFVRILGSVFNFLQKATRLFIKPTGSFQVVVSW